MKINLVLSAECQKNDGSWQESTLDITNSTRNILNINGFLQEASPEEALVK